MVRVDDLVLGFVFDKLVVDTVGKAREENVEVLEFRFDRLVKAVALYLWELNGDVVLIVYYAH